MARFQDSASLVEAKSRAVVIAREYPHGTLEPVHLLKAILATDDGTAMRATELLGLNIHEVRTKIDAALEDLPSAGHSLEGPAPSGALKLTLQQAETECEGLAHEKVDELHVLLALLSADGGLPKTLRRDLGYKRGPLIAAIEKLQKAEELRLDAPTFRPGPGGALTYCEDLTAKARRGEIDPVLGRGKEIARLVEILARRRKNNALIVGEPGTGKTALVEGLAQALSSSTVPPHLKNSRVYALDVAGMVAGAKYKGEFEERFKKLLTEVAARDNAILFIDEIHSLLGVGRGGGGVDAGSILKPALARGEIRVIGVTTTTEFREHLEKDAAFVRRFIRLEVNEPDDETTLEILRGIIQRYETHHGVHYQHEALQAAVKLSRRYIPTRFLPDKAIDLLDDAGADVRILAEIANRLLEAAPGVGRAGIEKELLAALSSRAIQCPAANENETESEALARRAQAFIAKTIDSEAIARRVSLATGIPVQRMSLSERERLVHLESHLHKRIIGQDGPIQVVADAIRRSRTGLKQKPSQPIGSFLFLGPTGTGKTELAKALAEFLFNDEQAMVRIDMTEYKSDYSIKRLVGADPGLVGFTEGGTLTEAVKRRPYSVVLFDEIDKAHPNCLDILIPLLDDGRLTDNKGMTIDCSNTVVILTSNYAGPWIARRIKERGSVTPEELRERLLTPGPDQRPGEIGFRPELLNRFDDLQVFRPLTKEQVRQIVDLQVDRLVETVGGQGISLEVTDAARREICEQGYDPEMGARPVRRTIDRLIGNELAMKLAGMEALPGCHGRVDVLNGNIGVEVESPAAIAAGDAAAAAGRG